MKSRKFGLPSLIFSLIFAIAVATPVFSQKPSSISSPVAYVSEEEGGVSVIDLKTFKVARSVKLSDLAARGLAVTHDGKYLVTADKDTQDMAIFSAPSLDLKRRVHVGENPEFIKLNPSGRRLFATFEPSSSGPPAAQGNANTDDQNGPPSQVASFRVGSWKPGPAFAAGQQTESIEFSKDGKLILVANEAQNTIGVFDEITGHHVRDVELSSFGARPRGLKVSPRGDQYAVTMESSGTLLLLDSNLNVKKSVLTAPKPYGVAFDRTGKRIFVSASKLQVFSADSLELLSEVATGQRCWHFTFTPDDSKVLVACGRSGNVVVVDANSYKVLQTIEGLKLPWGIVTYPPSYGSLGLP